MAPMNTATAPIQSHPSGTVTILYSFDARRAGYTPIGAAPKHRWRLLRITTFGGSQ